MGNFGSVGQKRIDGPDLFRFFAILRVLFGHMSEHFLPPPWLRIWSNHWGSLGVELCFVPSGYLIGGIIIRPIRAGKFKTSRDLLHFWLGRWLRTLLLYYLFPCLYLRLEWRGPFSPLRRAEICGRCYRIYPIYLLQFHGFAYGPYRLIERQGAAEVGMLVH